MNLSDSTVTRPRILVVGSLNLDHIWSVGTLPAPGHTILATSVRSDFGGKGANQAVAAARQGARVTLIGMLGDDEGGKQYARHLQGEGIDIAGLRTVTGTSTGAAHIYVDANGENMIIVNSGANARQDAATVQAVLSRSLRDADALLVQLENPLEVVTGALRLSHQQGVRSVLNASPYRPDFTWGTPIDTVIVNEHECRDFFGLDVARADTLTEQERRVLLASRGIINLIVTRGGESTIHMCLEGVLHVPVYPVVPRDTVGAGDTFAGALTVRRAEGSGWRDALRHANVCAALSTLVQGAQASIPLRSKVEQAIAAGTAPGGQA